MGSCQPEVQHKLKKDSDVSQEIMMARRPPKGTLTQCQCFIPPEVIAEGDSVELSIGQLAKSWHLRYTEPIAKGGASGESEEKAIACEEGTASRRAVRRDRASGLFNQPSLQLFADVWTEKPLLCRRCLH
jgi:hypothetical protein